MDFLQHLLIHNHLGSHAGLAVHWRVLLATGNWDLLYDFPVCQSLTTYSFQINTCLNGTTCHTYVLKVRIWDPSRSVTRHLHTQVASQQVKQPCNQDGVNDAGTSTFDRATGFLAIPVAHPDLVTKNGLLIYMR